MAISSKRSAENIDLDDAEALELFPGSKHWSLAHKEAGFKAQWHCWHEELSRIFPSLHFMVDIMIPAMKVMQKAGAFGLIASAAFTTVAETVELKAMAVKGVITAYLF